MNFALALVDLAAWEASVDALNLAVDFLNLAVDFLNPAVDLLNLAVDLLNLAVDSVESVEDTAEDTAASVADITKLPSAMCHNHTAAPQTWLQARLEDTPMEIALTPLDPG